MHITRGHAGIDLKRVRELLGDVRSGGLSITTLPDKTCRGVELMNDACLLIKHDRLAVHQTRFDIQTSFQACGGGVP